MEGNWEKALAAYQQMKKEKPDDRAFQEETINSSGYNLLGNGQEKMAAEVFKMNIALHPKSANTYDSYADALVELGDKQQAIANYQKALKLDPKLTETKKKLDDLMKANWSISNPLYLISQQTTYKQWNNTASSSDMP